MVSIVIPCYNHGDFILEAIESVESYPDKHHYEIIVVDDGSKDPDTVAVLDDLAKKGYQVLRQTNHGLACARNNGIMLARNEFILPLDSDNKIKSEYISEAVSILNANPEIGVVYGNSAFFGLKDGVNVVPEFSLKEILFQNTIDACAVFRKSAWLDVGGYDEAMPVMGYEDWDFWIRIAKFGWKFQHVDKVLFEYRVLADSMIKNTNMFENQKKIRHYMIQKHVDLYVTEESYLKLFDEYLFFVHKIMELDSKLARKDKDYRRLKSDTFVLLRLSVKNIINKFVPLHKFYSTR